MRPTVRLAIYIILTMGLALSLAAQPYYPSRQAYLERNPGYPEPSIQRAHEMGKSYDQSFALADSIDPDIGASFSAATDWITGIDWGGETFGGSIGKGIDFFGSYVLSESYVPVEIRFSNTDSTLCQVFRRDLGYASNGVGVFPGTAWDMSDPMNPRRLNLCFVEAAGEGTPDQRWNPTSTGSGGREYLYVMLSSYDGTGTTYAGLNGYNDNMDVLYNWWPYLNPGHSLLESLPAILTIEPFFVRTFRSIPDTTQVILTWNYGLAFPDHFDIYGGTASDSGTLIQTVDGLQRSWTHTGLTPNEEYFYRIEAFDQWGEFTSDSKSIRVVTESISSNMGLVSYWNNRNSYGDIWGWVDPSDDNEYALICVRNEGVSIVDIDAVPPVEVGFLESSLPGIDSKDVKVRGNIVFVVNEGADIQIWDITDPTTPNEIGSFSPDGGGAHNCLIEGDYMYVVGNHGTGGLEIVDISNPAAPFEVADFQPYYYHDLDIRNDTVCATAIYGDGIDLIDVSNKAAPSQIAHFNYAGSGAHNAEYSADGNYVFIGDEIGASGNHTRVFDVSNPLSVTLANDIIIDPAAVTHNCYIFQDTLLAIGHYTEGLRIWNVKDPTAPFEVGYFDSYLPEEYGYKGVWSVYTGLPSGRLIISDMQTGLYVLEFSPEPPGCCLGSRGNVNNDPEDKVNISDVTYLTAYLFGTPQGPLPSCSDEANVNSDPENKVNISDVTYLTAYLFGIPAGPLPGLCP